MTTIQIDDFGQLERTVLPHGEVFYRDSDHSYWRAVKRNPKQPGGWSGSDRLSGVSTVCGPLDFRPDPLLRWVERLTLEGVVRGFGGDTLPDDPHVLRQMLDSRSLRWEQIRDEAADRGTNAHEQMLHALATGEDIPDLGSLPEAQRGYGQAVFKWWMLRQPRVLQAEQVVLSVEHGFAGRLDLRCVVTPDQGEQGTLLGQETWLVDLKTSGFISTKAHAQLEGYELGAIESGFGPSDRRVILQAHEDGTFTEIESCATGEHFLDALKVYRATSAIGKAASAARKAAA